MRWGRRGKKGHTIDRSSVSGETVEEGGKAKQCLFPFFPYGYTVHGRKRNRRGEGRRTFFA